MFSNFQVDTADLAPAPAGAEGAGGLAHLQKNCSPLGRGCMGRPISHLSFVCIPCLNGRIRPRSTLVFSGRWQTGFKLSKTQVISASSQTSQPTSELP